MRTAVETDCGCSSITRLFLRKNCRRPGRSLTFKHCTDAARSSSDLRPAVSGRGMRWYWGGSRPWEGQLSEQARLDGHRNRVLDPLRHRRDPPPRRNHPLAHFSGMIVDVAATPPARRIWCFPQYTSRRGMSLPVTSAAQMCMDREPEARVEKLRGWDGRVITDFSAEAAACGRGN